MIKPKRIDCSYCEGTGIFFIHMGNNIYDTELCEYCTPNCNVCADTKLIQVELGTMWRPSEPHYINKTCTECKYDAE